MIDITERRAGVDWLSQTITHEEGAYASWRADGLRALELLGREGYVLKVGGLMGYRGMRAGACFVGTREDGTLVQFSGAHADRFYDTVFHQQANTPRIDIQVTAKFHTMPLELAKRYYLQSASANSELSVKKKLKLTYIEGTDGGATLYVGAPSSRQRGRIYNKEVQSSDPLYEKCWRFEVTFKDELAKVIGEKVAMHRHTRSVFCSQLIREWFGRRGIECPWYDGDHSTLLPLVRVLPTDVEKRLKWLERQVKPAIAELVGLGFEADVLEALGMSTST